MQADKELLGKMHNVMKQLDENNVAKYKNLNDQSELQLKLLTSKMNKKNELLSKRQELNKQLKTQYEEINYLKKRGSHLKQCIRKEKSVEKPRIQRAIQDQVDEINEMDQSIKKFNMKFNNEVKQLTLQKEQTQSILTTAINLAQQHKALQIDSLLNDQRSIHEMQALLKRVN